MPDSADKSRRKLAKNANVSMFPPHIMIIRAFADDDNRSYSNAAQTIIEQWAREHGYAHLLDVAELVA